MNIVSEERNKAEMFKSCFLNYVGKIINATFVSSPKVVRVVLLPWLPHLTPCTLLIVVRKEKGFCYPAVMQYVANASVKINHDRFLHKSLLHALPSKRRCVTRWKVLTGKFLYFRVRNRKDTKRIT